MKHVIAARKEIGVRTVFNVLGPLTNPAGAPNQVMGVYAAEWIPLLIDVLRRLGSEHVLIVAADDGLDEISIAADTRVGELKNGELLEYVVSPEEFGMRRRESVDSLRIESPEESLAMLRASLDYSHEDAGDIVALNAGAAIYAAGIEGSLVGGVARAQTVLKSGEALIKLEALVSFTQAHVH
jgi:anthranilate phosphoribosyltransferase